MPEPPLEILGRYKILRVIGRGAMGVVYEAIDPDIDRVVAIKTINLTLSPEEMVRYVARFKQEIKAAGRLNHPNIVTIYDVGKTETFAYMAMEFINGCELKDLLKAGTALPVDIALDIVAQAADGLAFAHSREIIHRDVKPANIMLLETEDGLVAKITDFGIARMPASAVKTMTGMVMGSPRYMSPEQVVGRNLSARSDIFSLGVVLYEALTGTAPFEADSISSIMYQTVHEIERPPSNVNPDLEPELDAIVAQALAKSPDDRFESMKAFSRRLREVIRSRTAVTPFTLAQLRPASGAPAAPSIVDAAGAVKLPVRTLPPEFVDGVERTAWPVSVANQFDSTIATLRLAEITAQTEELSEFISASRQMPAFKESGDMASPKVIAPVAPAASAPSANKIAAITLTLDPLPEPRKIPLPPLLLLGGLGSTVVILLVALLRTF